MANILLVNQGTFNTPLTVSKNWVINFIQCHSELKTHYSWKYNLQHAQCENSKIVQKWFKLVQSTVEQYSITDEDIYNFNEIEFAMSFVATAKVIMQNDYIDHSVLTQSGNCEWVTVIEVINLYSWALPPMIIFAGKTHHMT